jgi:hypothetical protein
MVKYLPNKAKRNKDAAATIKNENKSFAIGIKSWRGGQYPNTNNRYLCRSFSNL